MINFVLMTRMTSTDFIIYDFIFTSLINESFIEVSVKKAS